MENKEGEAMLTMNLDEAQARLREIVSRLQPGEEIVLTDNGQPLAKLVRAFPGSPGVNVQSPHTLLPARERPLCARGWRRVALILIFCVADSLAGAADWYRTFSPG